MPVFGVQTKILNASLQDMQALPTAKSITTQSFFLLTCLLLALIAKFENTLTVFPAEG